MKHTLQLIVIVIFLYVSTDEFNVQQSIKEVAPLPQHVVSSELISSSHIEPPIELAEKSVQKVSAKVTAYAPLDNKSGICAEGNPRITATGKKVSRGIVAVDPEKIPYGTQMYVPGYGHAVAEDTGGALRDYEGVQIDVLMDSYEEAIEWGVRYMDVEIVEEIKPDVHN